MTDEKDYEDDDTDSQSSYGARAARIGSLAELEDDGGGVEGVDGRGGPRENSYQIKYSPPRKGLFMLDVKLWGKHILGSPYRVQVGY